MRCPSVDDKQSKVLHLINAYRGFGHHHANLDPIGHAKRLELPNLSFQYHGLTEADLDSSFNVDVTLIDSKQAKLRDIINALEKTYCETIGVEYMHITNVEETRWIQQRLESVHSHPSFSDENKIHFATLLPGTNRAFNHG